MFTAIIPARGGSKRIYGKNTVQIAGKPLIEWTIQTAKAAGIFDRVIVSTDCPSIASVATAAGAHVSGLRPASLSDDHATLDVVMKHAIEAHDVTSDWVCLVYATACLMTPETLWGAAQLAQNAPPETDFVMGVRPYPHPIQRAIDMSSKHVQLLFPEHAKTRTQDLAERYHDAGQFVFGRRQAWLNGRTVWDSTTLGVPMAQQEAVDIDTPDDLVLADAIMTIRQARTQDA